MPDRKIKHLGVSKADVWNRRIAFIFIGLLLGLWYTALQTGEQRMMVFLSGYSFWDNTPAGSATIGRPVIHETAGGTGTYEDPVTLAVGWSIQRNQHFEDFKPGTLFYLPRLRKYAIVEDLCGDGPTPQSGPCHTGWEGYVWLDIYVDGSSDDAEVAQQCMERLTGIQATIINPRKGYQVAPGRIVESGCKLF